MRVVVAGSGFAGVECAKRLLHAGLDVTIVSPDLRFTYLPLVHELVSEEILPREATRDLAEVLPEARLVRGRAVRVEGKKLVLDSGEGVRFDRLVVAIGAETNDFGVPGVAEHVLPLWRLEDALRANGLLKQIAASRATPALAAEPASPGSLRARSAREPIVVDVVGAGPTGIEVAGEIAAFFERYEIAGHVRVVEALPDIFAPFSKEFRREIRAALKEAGIELVLNAKVKRAEAGRFHAEVAGEPDVLEHDLAFWCAGIKPRVLAPLSMSVRPTLQSVERDDIFVVGDCARFPKEMGRIPQLAQTAIQEGERAARNILAASPEKMKPYAPKVKGILVSVGPGHAVAELASGSVLAGNIPWHVKRALYKYKLAVT